MRVAPPYSQSATISTVITMAWAVTSGLSPPKIPVGMLAIIMPTGARAPTATIRQISDTPRGGRPASVGTPTSRTAR